jgi:hypothetical protein
MAHIGLHHTPGLLVGTELHHCAVVEALDPHGMVPTSTSSMYNVFDNVHMLWMGIWINHHAITTALVDPDLGIQPLSWVTGGR